VPLHAFEVDALGSGEDLVIAEGVAHGLVVDARHRLAPSAPGWRLWEARAEDAKAACTVRPGASPGGRRNSVERRSRLQADEPSASFPESRRSVSMGSAACVARSR